MPHADYRCPECGIVWEDVVFSSTGGAAAAAPWCPNHVHDGEGSRVLIKMEWIPQIGAMDAGSGAAFKAFSVDVDGRPQVIDSLHTLRRVELLRELRLGEYDVLVGINLLSEGLDLPEVELVAILDADKEGFLRSEVSLIQTIGRAARNSAGRVILYADQETRSLKVAISETRRRRTAQEAYNKKHGITPTTIIKNIKERKA